MKRIVLASASPRRKELLEQIGLRFEVEPSDCDEEIVAGSEPRRRSIGRPSLSPLTLWWFWATEYSASRIRMLRPGRCYAP